MDSSLCMVVVQRIERAASSLSLSCLCHRSHQLQDINSFGFLLVDLASCPVVIDCLRDELGCLH